MRLQRAICVTVRLFLKRFGNDQQKKKKLYINSERFFFRVLQFFFQSSSYSKSKSYKNQRLIDMTAISGSYINYTATKVMRVGSKLYCPIILPPGKREIPAVSKPSAGTNPLDITLSKSTCILEELQKQQVNQAKNYEPFVIEASGRCEIVRSPYSPQVDDVFLTLHEACYDNGSPKYISKEPSFHAALPSSTISRSGGMFDERLFDGISNGGSFTERNYSFSGTADTSAAAIFCTTKLSTQQWSDDPSFLCKHNTPMKEDEVMSDQSKSEKQEQDEDEESEFSVVSHQEEGCPRIKRKTNAGNRLKKSRRNHDSKQTGILMDWYLQNDGKTPNNQGKQDLAKATNLNVVQGE